MSVEGFEAVVIGSEFGGTILILSLANKFESYKAANNTLDFDKIVDIIAKTIDYFYIAGKFIDVNKIITNASLTRNNLQKTKVFQEAGQALIDEGNTSIINVVDDAGKKTGDFEYQMFLFRYGNINISMHDIFRRRKILLKSIYNLCSIIYNINRC